MKNRELQKSFFTSISFGTVIVGSSKLLSFILKILVSRLGVVNFSDYYLVTSTFSGLTTITALGIPMSATRYISFFMGKNKPKDAQLVVKSALTIALLSSFIAAIALYVGAQHLSRVIGAPHATVYFHILSFSLIGATITILARAIFMGYLRIQLAYAADAIEIGLKFIFTITGTLLLHWGVYGAIVGYATGTLAASLINIVLLAQISKIKRFIPIIKSEFLHFALPVSASEIITATTSVIFLYIVRLHNGAESIGFYGAAVSIASLIHVVPQMIFSIFLPIASAAFAQKRPILPIYKTLILWLCIVVLIPTVVLSILSPYITSQLFGLSYMAAAPILSILVVAYGLYAILVWPNRQILDMAGLTKENLFLTILRVVVIILSLIIFFPDVSGVGFAKAILFGWIGEAIGSILLIKQKQLI